jgi:hypothetical protein
MNPKLFQLTNDDDCEVTVEVDLDKLTQERATEINDFWGNPGRRVAKAGGSVIHAVVRMFALESIYAMLYDSGAVFDERHSLTAEKCAKDRSIERRAQEGWGGEDDTPYGWCGMRLVAADVRPPDEDEFAFKEVDS